MKISLVCSKFRYGGGIERYLIDLVNGFHEKNILPNVYSAKFDKDILEYSFINPIEINLSLIPKPLRNYFLSYFSNRIKSRSKEREISITTTYTKSDIVICGGNHIGYLRALNKKPTFLDLIKIKNEKRRKLSYFS